MKETSSIIVHKLVMPPLVTSPAKRMKQSPASTDDEKVFVSVFEMFEGM
jgi:hypothetical protein